MSLRGGSQKDRNSEVSRGNKDDRRKKHQHDDEGLYFHNYDDEDDDDLDSNPYRRRDSGPRYDRPDNDRIYEDVSDDSRRSDRHSDNYPRRPKGSERDRRPSDRRRPRDDRDRGHPDRRRDRRRSSPERDDDRRYSPPPERGEISDRPKHPRQDQIDRYDDPWDIPKNRDKDRRRPHASDADDDRNSPPDKHKDNGKYSPPHGRRRDRRNSPPGMYEKPWDTHGKNAPERRVPSDNSLDESHEDYTPRYYDQIANPPSSEKNAMETNGYTKDKEKNGLGRYKDENGHVTVDLGPGIYKPVRLDPPPLHHSRSKDNTPYPSQGSKLDASQPSGDDDKEKVDYGEDENEERGNWSGKFDFILSMLGYAVGLGNVWRFPYLCYRNGGGAFLFPFLLMMVIIGLPLFYLEASLGQFSSCGAMTCWEFAPLFKGLGIAMVMVSAMTGIYYNMILGWSLHYMFSSFTSDLPFDSCENEWNTDNCKLKLPIMTCTGTDDEQSEDGRCLDGDGNEIGLWNKTLFTEVTGRVLQSPAQEYWERYVLQFSDGIEYFGQPKWDLVLCLLLAWVICFLCLIKGIKTTGKVVYFTAIFPYVVLLILFFRGVTLENAGIGVKYFITPNFERLADANVWKDAANQIFFSMSIAGGGLITLSSYNRFHNNILRDSLIVALGDSFTCILGGFVIFSYLGYMAGQLDVGIEKVAADGAGLAFVVYPEAVSNLPPPTLWALLFFFMLLLLGLDSQFAMIETVLTGVLDQYPRLRPKKTLVIAIICIILFILGLPLTCPGGMYLLQLMDNYVGGMTLIIIGFVEILAVVFIYGVKRFCQDINMMTGSTRFLFWKVTWCVLSPLTIVFIFVFMFIDYKASTYDKYTYPPWADVIGWFFTMASVLAIPIVMLFKISRETEGKNAWQKLRLLCLPTMYWGPALKKHRVLVDYVDGFQVDPYKGLQPRTTFVNYGFDNSTETNLKAESKNSLGASRISVISSLSRATATTTKSEKSGLSFETNV